MCMPLSGIHQSGTPLQVISSMSIVVTYLGPFDHLVGLPRYVLLNKVAYYLA